MSLDPQRNRSSTNVSTTSSSYTGVSSPGPSVSQRGFSPTGTRSRPDLSLGTLPTNRQNVGNLGIYNSTTPISELGSPPLRSPSAYSSFSVATSTNANRPKVGRTSSSRSLLPQQQRARRGTISNHSRRKNPISIPLGLGLGESMTGNLVAVGISGRPEDVDLLGLAFEEEEIRKEELGFGSRSGGEVENKRKAGSRVDDLFISFGVREVRGLESKARESADAKKDELRTMVGERYRDLLSAADSIVRMRRSSVELMDKLDRARDGISVGHGLDERGMNGLGSVHGRGGGNGTGIPRARGGRSLMDNRTPQFDPQTSDIRHPYALSTSIKLLLDSPEHVWHCVDKEDFLGAARLEGVARVVYRELVGSGVAGKSREAGVGGDEEADPGSEDDEDEEDYNIVANFPIIERQWEIISHLSPQISRRAVAHLKRLDTSPRMTTETLAAILMLENSSLPDTLGLLLSVRTKSLSSLLDRHHVKLETSEAGPGGDREVGDIVTKLRDGLGLIVKTVAQVRESFGRGGESLLRLLEQVQNVTSDRSRQAVEEATNGFSTTPTSDPSSSSLHSILQTLPNAHHLLRYLPSGIVSFTPFIDTKSSRNHLPASTVEERTEEWFRESVKSLCAGAARMLEGTWTAKKLMKVKRDVLGFGDDVETVGRERRDLEAALVEVLKKRLEEIYKVRLEELVEGVRKFLDDGLRTLPDSSEDLEPADFVFSPSIPFPSSAISLSLTASTFTSTSKPPKDSFDIYREAIGIRVRGRSPLLGQGLGSLESKAKELSADLREWMESVGKEGDGDLRSRYLASVGETFENIIKTTRHALDKATELAQADSSLFIGTFALHLASSASLTKDLLLAGNGSTLLSESSKSFQINLRRIHKESLGPWREKAVSQAVEVFSSRTSTFQALASLAPHHSGEDPSPNSQTQPLSSIAQPSDALLAFLHALLDATKSVGPHQTSAEPDILQDLSASLIKPFLETIRGIASRLPSLSTSLRSKASLQLCWDLTLLEVLMGSSMEEHSSESAALKAGLLSEVTSQAPDTVVTLFRSSATDYARRVPTLFAPIILPSPATTLTPKDRGSSLLPFGQPPASSTTFRSPVTSARFGLLAVASR